MAALTLVIGEMNLSSWSMRPWFALRQAGIAFDTVKVMLDRPESRANLAKHSPSGLVPVLKHGERTIWDSLAICEYVNDLHPDKNLWPADMAARAHARSLSAEMHSGFSQLRALWPLQAARANLRHLTSFGVGRDIARIGALWSEARETFGAKMGGPFLYGQFSIADAMYAPVVSRFRTYGPVDLPAPAADYMATMLETPAMAEWIAGACAEISAEFAADTSCGAAKGGRAGVLNDGDEPSIDGAS